MEIFHFLPTRQVNSQAYDIMANTPIADAIHILKVLIGDQNT